MFSYLRANIHFDLGVMFIYKNKYSKISKQIITYSKKMFIYVPNLKWKVEKINIQSEKGKPKKIKRKKKKRT
jgi:hypothetical protein